uniref:Uncharacterized protein n=1 Tax=Streptomyces sp. W75 TaxID=1170711 RepID=I0CED2_9ACTN|nr:hypothetical protein [Streptomyces sp. W75]AFH75145.1 hypothetical protein pCQ4.20c [Streptomyces sp. W75]
MTTAPDLTDTQKAYNVAQAEMFQLAAYGHHRYHPSGECLTAEGRRQARDYNYRIQAAREELNAALLRLVAEHLETFHEAGGISTAWLRSLADDPGHLSLLAVRPDEREFDTVAVASRSDVTTPPLRDRIADAIRAATCPGECGNSTEEECRRTRFQPVVWYQGRVIEVDMSGPVDRIAALIADALTKETP